MGRAVCLFEFFAAGNHLKKWMFGSPVGRGICLLEFLQLETPREVNVWESHFFEVSAAGSSLKSGCFFLAPQCFLEFLQLETTKRWMFGSPVTGPSAFWSFCSWKPPKKSGCLALQWAGPSAFSQLETTQKWIFDTRFQMTAQHDFKTTPNSKVTPRMIQQTKDMITAPARSEVCGMMPTRAKLW